jgi:hypothetical protein
MLKKFSTVDPESLDTPLTNVMTAENCYTSLSLVNPGSATPALSLNLIYE